jgi:hypothetical protein
VSCTAQSTGWQIICLKNSFDSSSFITIGLT